MLPYRTPITPFFQSINSKHFSPEMLRVRNKTMAPTKTYALVSFCTITKYNSKAALMGGKSASIFHDFREKKNPARIALNFFKSHKIKKMCSY